MKAILMQGITVLAITMVLTACNSATTSNSVASTSSTSSATPASSGDTIHITLAQDAIQADSEAVSVEGTVVTLTAAGTYQVTGTLNDGQLVVEAPEEDVEIILDGVQIHNASGPAIHILEAKNTTIIVQADSELSDGEYTATDTDDAPSAAIYSMSDLKLKGEGNAVLTVTGNTNDAVVSKDDLKIKDLILEVAAVDDGVRGKDSIKVDEATLTLTVGGDGLKSDNEEDEERGVITIEDSEITLTAGDDGMHAVSMIDILSGDITILGSYEGIESKQINIHEGTITITARDDALNVAGSSAAGTITNMMGGRGGGFDAVLEGGELNIYSGTITIDSGGDGFDSNGNATMTGGTLIVNGPVNDGNGAIDVNGSFDVSGGTIIAVGSSGMAETPSNTSSQLALQVNFESTQAAGTPVALQDSSGTEIFSFTPSKQFQSVTYSSAVLQEGESYTFLLGSESYTTLTLSDTVTRYGTAARMGGGPMGGGMPMGDMMDKTPPGMTLPDNWESMTDDERQAYMEANRPQRPFGDMNVIQ